MAVATNKISLNTIFFSDLMASGIGRIIVLNFILRRIIFLLGVRKAVASCVKRFDAGEEKRGRYRHGYNEAGGGVYLKLGVHAHVHEK